MLRALHRLPVAAALLVFAIAACTSFSGSPEPPRVTPDGGGASASPEASTVDAALLGPAEQPRVGQGCAGRVPVPKLCDDYEHGGPTSKDVLPGATLAIGDTGSQSLHGLHATVDANTSAHAFALALVESTTPIESLSYTYDLHIDAALAPATELVQLSMSNTGTFCAVQTRYAETTSALDLLEYCDVDERPIATIPLPSTTSVAYWINVYVSLDFKAGRAVIRLRTEDGRASEQSGPLTVALGPGAALEPGIGHYRASETSTALDIDNFAAFWR